MKRLARVSTWALMLAMVVGSVSVAYADDGEMFFGEDEVDDVDLEYLEELIDEGQRLYDQRSFEEASLRFFDVLQDDTPGAEGYYPQAEYELARTLFRLQLYQGALTYFGQIAEEGDFHPYFQPALRGLLLLTEVIPGDAELARHMASYSGHFPEVVPEDFRDRYAYLVGRHLYENLDLDEAVELLETIDSESEYYAKARYITAITHVADYEAEPAVEAFRDVLRYLEGLDTPLDRLTGEEALLLDLAHLGMARVFYSTGQFDTSLSYYERVHRESPRWPDALFESSWGFFNIDRFNQALGNLHTLNSPFFEDAYFPEGPILAAVIYFYNCNYDLVRETLDDFDFIFEEVQEELQAILAEHDDDMSAYEWGQQWRNGGVEGSPEFESALRSNLQDRQFELRFNLLDAIDREMERMAALPDSWQTSYLGDELMQEASLAHSFATSDAGELVRRRLERAEEELGNLLNQQDRILFEVARAERGEVEAEIRAGMQVEDEVIESAEIEVSSEEMYWPFEGEYWYDELGFYYFDIQSQCRR